MPARRFAVALLTALALAAGPAARAGWDAARTTSPETVAELKQMQAKVKETTAKVTPATVGLLVGFGAGSGVIVSDDGLILTAAHVIGEAGADLVVVLSDGTRVKGKSLGLNAKLDSGMAKITDPAPKDAKWPGVPAGKWPKAELGSSAKLKKGQWVISLGQHGGPKAERTPPLRVGRFEYSNPVERFLRSDCTLVGGDSGGPLFDLDGKVVGIHSRIGLFIDQNLHVPVDAFQEEWADLVKGADIGRAPGGLGVELDVDVDAPTVTKVEPRGAGDRAGLKVGDKIVRFDDVDVASRADLRKLLGKVRAGQEVDLVVERDGETVELTVTLGRRPRPRPTPDE